MHHPSVLFTLLAFALLLGPLVLLHELGHYLVARMFDIKSDVFSIGFGKEVFGWTDSRGTRWKLSALPLGGYVQFAGDANAASQPGGDRPLSEAKAGWALAEKADSFHIRPLWQRAAVVAAGPVMNLLIALVIFTAFNLAYGRIEAIPQVSGFAPQSPAQVAGIQVGDKVVSVNGTAITSFEQIRPLVAPYPGQMAKVGVMRGGKRLDFNFAIATHVERDEFGNEARMGMLGIAAKGFKRVAVGPIEAVGLAGRQTWGVIDETIVGLGQIFAGQRSAKELGGPVKIAQYSGQQLALGWLNFVDFAALISINLAFINLLPIPGLDGGHLAFYLAEAVRRKPLDGRGAQWAFRTGLALVLAVIVFVTVNDLASLHRFGG